MNCNCCRFEEFSGDFLGEKWVKILEEGIRKGKLLIKGRLEDKPVVDVTNAVYYLDKKGYPWELEELGYGISGMKTDWYCLSDWEEDFDSSRTYEEFKEDITYNEFITKYGNSTK